MCVSVCLRVAECVRLRVVECGGVPVRRWEKVRACAAEPAGVCECVRGVCEWRSVCVSECVRMYSVCVRVRLCVCVCVCLSTSVTITQTCKHKQTTAHTRLEYTVLGIRVCLCVRVCGVYVFRELVFCT